MQDSIERTIDIDAPLERVWSLVTDAGWWIPVAAPTEPVRAVGGVAIRDSEWGLFPVEVVELRPMTYASFRWASLFPGEDLTRHNTTLIEFTLEASGDGVRVSVLETGFSQLDAPDELKAREIEANSGGWTAQLDVLRGLAES